MRSDYTKIEAGSVFFAVWHEQWDANIQHHADQGVIIQVRGDVEGRETNLLQFNCFHAERSYTYAPDGEARVCQIDPIADGNPFGWTARQLRERLPAMLARGGFDDIAASLDMEKVTAASVEVEAAGREKFRNCIQLVKHKRGDHMFEAGNIRFGLELRTLGDDGGLAIHVLSDLCGSPNHEYSEETEILAFDCFRVQPHYHYGPRNKNLRYYWDKTVVTDALEWTMDVLKAGKLRPMIEAAGYPDVARDLDEDIIRSLLPSIEAKARELQPKAEVEALQAAE
jgi:hypothetical protein